MTSIAKIIRKVNKKAARQADKKARAQIVAEHNLAFDYRKVVETEKKQAFKVVDAESWNSPYRGDINVPTPSLAELFMVTDHRRKETVVVPEGI